MLKGESGEDRAIHLAAGKDLTEECRSLNGCRVGEAKATCGYNLPAKYVIHTVAPTGKQIRELSNCYFNALNLAMTLKCRTIVSSADQQLLLFQHD